MDPRLIRLIMRALGIVIFKEKTKRVQTPTEEIPGTKETTGGCLLLIVGIFLAVDVLLLIINYQDISIAFRTIGIALAVVFFTIFVIGLIK